MGEKIVTYIVSHKWFFIVMVVVIIAIWYFFFNNPSDKSTKTISGPSLSDAKKSLEKKIFANDFVTSIGTRNVDSKSFIQISVKSADHIKDIQAFLTDGKWEGYTVDIVIEQPPVAQAKETKKPEMPKPVKAKWHFKTIITGISANQKRLAVNLHGGDTLIPEQFKQGQAIKLHIHQTSDYIYDVNGKIISIDANRDSMLVTFPGKVADNAFGDIELN